MPTPADFPLAAAEAAPTTGGASVAECLLLAAVPLLMALALWLPPMALPADYHRFADQRMLAGVPHALDVLTNLAFGGVATWGLWVACRVPRGALPVVQRVLAVLLFIGLLGTAVGSSLYHLAPDNAGLTLDRLGMALPFAALLGLAAADRISARAGVVLALVIAVAAPTSALLDALTGNMTPWTVLQTSGLVLLLALATQRPRPQALGFSLLAVVLTYAAAKGLELADAPVFAWTAGAVSGHSLKHVVAALAVWPVVCALARKRVASARHGDTAQCTPNGTSSQRRVL
ncbi:hypothetical protein FVQ98_06580 [Ottowia sp. GY511]|uniref:Alkaline phytoceramidase n=1 Tax=Ottowia flava TaxID=2675430 RepID=A0ABW4KTH6_9BURK|nr:hypothetical protein [Ottowia sp. GY511]TXK30962.1 hypothetical protein FVQ98_06580 [Ottowia sp. GY511]